MAVSPPVRDWKCTYYDATKKRWFPGSFQLFPSQLKFVPDSTGNATPTSPFYSITAINKETTTLIFGAITVTMRGGIKHWFSSFKQRDSTFFVVSHFWKNHALLQDKPSQTTTVAAPGELAACVLDAQKTLEGAARELHSQGRQLDRASRMMNEIHSDLDVAERILKDMGSWLDMWRASKDLVHYVENERKKKKKMGDLDAKFPVLFNINGGPVHRPGDIEVRVGQKDRLVVYNERQKEVFQAEAGSQLSLTAHTPYHFSLTHEPPTKTIEIISVIAVAIIEDISKQFPIKIEYKSPPDFADSPTAWDTNESSITSDTALLTWTEAAEIDWTRTPSTTQQVQAQAVKTQTRDELGLVSKGLEEMRQLAVTLSEETEAQLEVLDQLNVSVDKATQRTKADSRRARELAN